MASVTTPQFVAPFQLDSTGQPVVVEQNSPEDVASCVYNIAVCPQGSKLGDPAFGVPSLLFATQPLNASGILAAIQRLEPRATYEIATQVLAGGVEDIAVNVQVLGPPTETAS